MPTFSWCLTTSAVIRALFFLVRMGRCPSGERIVAGLCLSSVRDNKAAVTEFIDLATEARSNLLAVGLAMFHASLSQTDEPAWYKRGCGNRGFQRRRTTAPGQHRVGHAPACRSRGGARQSELTVSQRRPWRATDDAACTITESKEVQ